MPRKIVPVPAEPDPSSQPLPAWLLVPLGLLLLLISAGCSKEKLLSFIPGTNGKTSPPLNEVLPGRWDIHSKGHHFVVHFGRHSEMSFVLDVPPELQDRLKLQQIWVGGNYQTDGNSVSITFTDGRFAAALAQMHGLQLHHVQVQSFTSDAITDVDQDTWQRIGSEPNEPPHEARDLAANPPPSSKTSATGQLPAIPAVPIPDAAQTKRLKAERARLSALYEKLEKRRRALKLKDQAALAAFNKDAADYTHQLSILDSGNAISLSPDGTGPKPASIGAVPQSDDAHSKVTLR